MNKWTKLVLGAVVAGMVSSATLKADDAAAPTDAKKGAKKGKKDASCKGNKKAKPGASCKGEGGCKGEGKCKADASKCKAGGSCKAAPEAAPEKK